MNEKSQSFSQLLQSLPENRSIFEWQEEIQALSSSGNRRVIILDDDPTGVQTVHDIDVLTSWDLPLLKEAMNSSHAFFILTNTRGMQADEAERINTEIAKNAHIIASELRVQLHFISRSDSTLRGYYPLEVNTLANEMEALTGRTVDAHFIIPAFFEGGRYTYDSVHYLLEGESLTPVNHTEFANDKVFGFSHANLSHWVEEKTDGKVKARDCIRLSLEDIRKGPEHLEELVIELKDNQTVVVDAMNYGDLECLSLALLRSEKKGKLFLFRTAASFVKAYCGITDQPLLSKDTMINSQTEQSGGLIIVGSHVQKTTQQLNQVLNHTETVSVEIHVDKIIDQAQSQQELEQVIQTVNEELQAGRDVVVYSSRALVSVNDKLQNLKISQMVSEALVQVMKSVNFAPRFIIAKGGITSSDIATKGLGIRKAKVLGQAMPGIPVWLTGEETKFPGIPYIVFPGNVGTETTLLELVKNISG